MRIKLEEVIRLYKQALDIINLKADNVEIVIISKKIGYLHYYGVFMAGIKQEQKNMKYK